MRADADRAGTHRRWLSGQVIAGLKTDGQGHLYLRYYSPGLIPAESSSKVSQPVATKLKVVAKESCSPSQCSAQQKSGHQSLQLKLVPNLIHSHDGTLSRTDERCWSSIYAISSYFPMPPVGIEPTTFGLKVRCSAS